MLNWRSYWDEGLGPECLLKFRVGDSLWSQGLLSPGQLILEVLGFLPELSLDCPLHLRGQVPDGPLRGLGCFCVPLDLINEPGEEGCLCLD